MTTGVTLVAPSRPPDPARDGRHRMTGEVRLSARTQELHCHPTGASRMQSGQIGRPQRRQTDPAARSGCA
ncbi:MAG TPA: hypothetical protein VFH58_05755 [Acidimicrobiales bacterium]|nr:hypothetical protein [Acidimicrobiales bacterium]